jgi:hypothetical protein
MARGWNREGVERPARASFYFYNWICVNGSVAGDPIGQTWSLSIEEQFYLLWPIVLLIALRRGGQQLAMRIAVIGAVAALVDRIILFAVQASISRVYFTSDNQRSPSDGRPCASARTFPGQATSHSAGGHGLRSGRPVRHFGGHSIWR